MKKVSILSEKRKGINMGFIIEYACISFQGLIRKNNEDNMICRDYYLPEIHRDSESIIAGDVRAEENPIFVVLDGLGGEQAGETASYIAAKELNKEYVKKRINCNDRIAYIERLCCQVNLAICEYAKTQNISSMGTTLAGIIFEGDYIYGFNLGDSRIYCFQDKRLIMVSTDHVARGGLYRKAPLIQYLGIPEEEMKISPYIWKASCEENVKFLLCTDGLTDMLSDVEIEQILSDETNIQLCVERLRERVFQKGAVDNTTIILCEIKKISPLFSVFRRINKRDGIR